MSSIDNIFAIYSDATYFALVHYHQTGFISDRLTHYALQVYTLLAIKMLPNSDLGGVILIFFLTKS